VPFLQIMTILFSDGFGAESQGGVNQVGILVYAMQLLEISGNPEQLSQVLAFLA
jgi:hypothetical protein